MFKVIDSEIFTIYNLINWIQGNNETFPVLYLTHQIFIIN